ncbi:MAG: MerR family transcriptional regulator [Bifidobacteriaceae bacterium]|jgi:DNA-binding transcriptional MerR regulator|nr:MerR family transcriptional regulator [Bifidobacteriaceae bacterium]
MDFTIKQIADLVGMTPRTLRHYESMGLLPEPERTYGNYRVYWTGYIVTLLRIKRLTSVGFSLTEVKEILEDPGSAASIGALKERDRRLKAHIDEVRAQRQMIREMLRSGGALDVNPRFAALLERLRNIAPSADEAEIDKMRSELVAGLGSESDIERHLAILKQQTTMADNPEFVALKQLDERFDSLPPDTTREELEDMISAYLDALAIVYSRLDQKAPSALLRQMTNALNADLYNEAQALVAQRVMDTLHEQLAS